MYITNKLLLTSLRDILDNIALGKIVYTLYLKEYQIQPLSYGKMGVELYIGQNTSVINTLRGTARQVTDTL